jgi:hypothetical protein
MHKQKPAARFRWNRNRTADNQGSCIMPKRKPAGKQFIRFRQAELEIERANEIFFRNWRGILERRDYQLDLERKVLRVARGINIRSFIKGIIAGHKISWAVADRPIRWRCQCGKKTITRQDDETGRHVPDDPTWVFNRNHPTPSWACCPQHVGHTYKTPADRVAEKRWFQEEMRRLDESAKRRELEEQERRKAEQVGGHGGRL